MTLWIIEPRDPLIVRDGRPFGPNPGARAASLPFPMPSTVVGGLRHKAGLNSDGTFRREAIATVLELALRGPLLVELDDADSVTQFLFPAPADALSLDPDAPPNAPPSIRIQRLAPRTLVGAPTTSQPKDLQLIAPPTRVPNKVSPRAPHFWRQEQFERWLVNPADDATLPLSAVGLGALETNARTHVSVEFATQTAREGALFQTRGLEFTWRDREAERHQTFRTARLALAAAFERDTQPYTPEHFSGGLAPLGGERRLMRWTRRAQQLPGPPEGLFDAIVRDRHARVILLTPALFDEGYRPSLQWTLKGVTATLEAAAVPRPQVISGWDMDADNGVDAQGRPRPRGKPRETRRLAPAGAVYFVSWAPDADVATWLQAAWMQNLSDSAKDQRNGFGLAAVGVWPQPTKEQQR
jgi:CRISPR-associated protein Cmr3